MFIKKFNGKNAILVTVLSATMVFLAGCDNKIVNFTDELKHINIPEATESVSETEENESESTTEPEGTVEPESTAEIESTDVPETENTEEVEPDNTAESAEETEADNDVENTTEFGTETNDDGSFDGEERIELETNTTETTPTPSETVDATEAPEDDKSEKKGGTKIIAVALIGGFSLLAVVAVIIIVVLNGKKSKHKDAYGIPVNAAGNAEVAELSRPASRVADSNIGIRILSGQDTGRAYRFLNGNTIRIGRDPKWADLVVDKKFADVSRAQCIVEFDSDEGIYYVTDCSGNGTIIEHGRRLEKGIKTPVQRGTVLRLGSPRFKIKLM